jgi:O-antigen biosynthesis protein
MLLTAIWNYFHKADTPIGRTAFEIIAQCLLLLRRGGYRGLKAHINRQVRSQARSPVEYAVWITARTRASTKQGDMAGEWANMAYKPVFSIIIPISGNQATFLNETIQSVLAQAYPSWELCLIFGKAPDAGARSLLEEEHALSDKRVKAIPGNGDGSLSRTLNRGLSAATGDFICLVEPGDEISPEALLELAVSINARPDADMLYSDEDCVDAAGNRSRPFFKPDWSPEYLESLYYTGQLSCYRTELSRTIGGFRHGFEGAEQYDFVLRFVEKARNIVHLPEVLYHRRSMLDPDEDTTVDLLPRGNSPVRALTERLERLDAAGSVKEARPGCFDVRRVIVGSPLVTIIIPSAGNTSRVHGRDTDLLANCVQSIGTKSTYPNYEIIVVDNGDLKAGTIESVSAVGCRFLHFREKVFNIAKKMNLGARHAHGDHLLFLNDDTEIIADDWLQAMLQFSQQSGIGAVGAKLYYENGTIQHVGATLNDDGLPDHLYRGSAGDAPGYFFSSLAARTCLAVTGACLMTRKEVFEKMGGFSEDLAISYNDIDYCLKAHVAGYRNVFTPHAELFHYEAITRARAVDFSESALFLQRWHAKVPVDPYYSTHLDTYPPNFRIRTPRVSDISDPRSRRLA